jgi:four helix bundle protein
MVNIPKKHAVFDQLDRASTSISLNIAEGNGKSLPRDRSRYFEIARGSALECAAALDVLVAKDILKEKEITEGKQILKETVSMIVGLIKRNMPDPKSTA